MKFGNFIEQAEQEDPREKRLKMLKRQVLQKKMQAVRQGGEGITASYEPEGEMVEDAKHGYDSKGNSLNPKDKKRHPRDQKELDRAQAYIKKNPNFGKKDVKEAKVDEKLPDYKRATARDKRYGNPHGSHELGGGIRKDRRADHEAKRGVKKEELTIEAKVDAGKSPETKEKDRNVRKFGVSHNVSGHGKLRRSLHKMNRGDKKIKGDKSAWTEMESVQYEGVGDEVRKGLKRHKDAVEKKKVKDRKAVPYAALAAEHQPEGEMVEEVSRRSKPSAKAKMAKLDAILQRREDRKVKEKEALKTEGWLGKKKKEEKKPEKAMDAGARLRRKKQRQEYADKVSGSVDNVPDDIRDHVEHMDEGVGRALGNAAKGAAGYAAQVAKGAIGSAVKGLNDPDHKPNAAEWTKNKPSSSSSSTGGASAAKTQADKANKARVDARKKAIKKIKDDRRERATNIMTAEKAAKKVKKEGEDKKFKADSEKPIVAEFVDHLWEAKKKCSKCGKVYTGKSCSCCAK